MCSSWAFLVLIILVSFIFCPAEEKGESIRFKKKMAFLRIMGDSSYLWFIHIFLLIWLVHLFRIGHAARLVRSLDGTNADFLALLAVLLWADMLATYVMWIMQKYLTDVWKLGVTHAAGIMNIYTGLTKFLPLVFFIFVDAGLSNYRSLLLSSIAFSIVSSSAGQLLFI